MIVTESLGGAWPLCPPESASALDDLWKVKIQCQRSDVVLCWSKSCITSPFPLMAASYMAENTISLKNRSEAVPLMTS